LRKEIEQIDARLPVANAERKDIEQRLMSALPAAELAAAGKRLKQLTDEIEQCENRWLELNELVGNYPH
jgi:ATP-binding cassette subfamily F protein 3